MSPWGMGHPCPLPAVSPEVWALAGTSGPLPRPQMGASETPAPSRLVSASGSQLAFQREHPCRQVSGDPSDAAFWGSQGLLCGGPLPCLTCLLRGLCFLQCGLVPSCVTGSSTLAHKALSGPSWSHGQPSRGPALSQGHSFQLRSVPHHENMLSKHPSQRARGDARQAPLHGVSLTSDRQGAGAATGPRP